MLHAKMIACPGHRHIKRLFNALDPLCPGNCLYMWVKSVDVQLGTMGEGEATIFLHSFLQVGRCFAHFVNMGIVTKSVSVTLLPDSSLISLSPSWLMWPAVDCTCGPGRRASLWICGQCRKIIGPYGMNLWFEKCGKLKSKLWYGWAITNLFPRNRYKVQGPLTSCLTSLSVVWLSGAMWLAEVNYQQV